MTTNFDQVKDSGKREDFSTGSRRDSRDGKGRYDLLSPHTTRRDAKHMENGAKKYGDRNWEKGQPFSRFMDSAMRHMNCYLAGMRDEDHLSAARWNLGCIAHFEELIAQGATEFAHLDDLPKITPVPETAPVPPTKSEMWGLYAQSWEDSGSVPWAQFGPDGDDVNIKHAHAVVRIKAWPNAAEAQEVAPLWMCSGLRPKLIPRELLTA